jgi:aspartyl-tRNA synthetase
MRAPIGRPGEFYQLDFEMSFVTQEDVFAAIEPVLHGVFEEFADWQGKGRTVSGSPFQRIPYRESMLKYGSTSPICATRSLIVDVTDEFKGSGFGIFARSIVESGQCRARHPRAGCRHEEPQILRRHERAGRASEGYTGLGYATHQGWRCPAARSPRIMARKRPPG